MRVEQIEEMPAVDMMRELIGFFGLRRALELIGWACYWSVWCGHEDPKVTEEFLASSKVSRAAAFLALSHFKKFGQHLREIDGRDHSRGEVLQRLAHLQIAS